MINQYTTNNTHTHRSIGFQPAPPHLYMDGLKSIKRDIIIHTYKCTSLYHNNLQMSYIKRFIIALRLKRERESYISAACCYYFLALISRARAISIGISYATVFV